MILTVLVGFTIWCIWLAITFLDLPTENEQDHKFDARKHWDSKEHKWRGKQ